MNANGSHFCGLPACASCHGGTAEGMKELETAAVAEHFSSK